MSASQQDQVKRGDSLEFIRAYLRMALQIGAQAYNLGDHRGAYEVYACTARLLRSGVQGSDEARQILRGALEECSTQLDVTEMTWIMRRAFDAILGTHGTTAQDQG